MDLARAQKAASGRKIRAYSDTKELLSAEKPDIVSICTPDADHFDTFKQVASFPSVKGIWCEKPIAINVAQGEEMVQLAKDNGIALVVNYIRRYQSFYQSIKKEMNTLLGEIRRITCYYSGGITTNGSHLIDLLHYFFGRCESVSARKENSDYIAKLSFGSFDAEFFPIDAFSILEMDIIGSQGRLDLIFRPFYEPDYRYHPLVKNSKTNLYYLSDKPTPLPLLFDRKFFSLALSDLVRAIEEKSAPISPGESALFSVQVLSAISSSATQKSKEISLSSNLRQIPIPVSGGEIKKWKN